MLNHHECPVQVNRLIDIPNPPKMHFSLPSSLLLAASLLESTIAQTTYRASTKRGLVFVPAPKYPTDNQIWVQGQTDITWYYNYQATPSAAFSNLTQDKFEFVPMLWSPADTFLSTIQGLIKNGRNITHVMGYNEPDGEHSTGGSSLDYKVAATNWIAQMEPLRKMGVKLGAPAVTGSSRGMTWLRNFFDACASQGTNCTADFFPSHWYGNFEGLASHLGEIAGVHVFPSYHPLSTVLIIFRYPNKTIWITEYALNNQSLSDTQSFFNTSAEYFDRLENVERYSYFGSFRSDVSNVGPNAAMLNNKGELTDIGAWYLGRAATGNQPGGKSAAPRTSVGTWMAVAVLGVSGFLML